MTLLATVADLCLIAVQSITLANTTATSHEFLKDGYALVDASVKRYVERGFTNLMVCFGCTGGQHRSVYCAQHMAEHINKVFNLKVELVHREQNIEQTFLPKK